MSDFGQLSYFLGIQFKFEGNSVKMMQSLYLQKIMRDLICKIVNQGKHRVIQIYISLIQMIGLSMSHVIES